MCSRLLCPYLVCFLSSSDVIISSFLSSCVFLLSCVCIVLSVQLFRLVTPRCSCLCQPCLVLPCLALSCPVLPCPALSCPVLPCLALSCPVLFVYIKDCYFEFILISVFLDPPLCVHRDTGDGAGRGLLVLVI